MPSKAVERIVSVRRTGNYRGSRASHFSVKGYRNTPEWPTRMVESPLSLSYIDATGCRAHAVHNAGGWYEGTDAPNMRSYYYAHATGWNERLYATAYAKFVNAARQGSAEWGMNIVQARSAYATLIQLSLTAATTVTAFCHANRRAIKWLASHSNQSATSVKKMRRRRGRDLVRARTAAERRRLSNEVWLLDQVTSTLLAYRYGVAPLMSDIFSTAEFLSSEFTDDVQLRKSAKTLWSGTNTAWDDKWQGTESVVLRATCSVSNPNLLLANRLGLINPQQWVWDAIPYSFVVDWWGSVGQFLGNFTALVGLSLRGASVTRTRKWAGLWTPTYGAPQVTYRREGDMRFRGMRKERTTGSLPIPLSVPYGTGLGIQRAQNAVALIVQKLKPGRNALKELT